MIHEDIFEDHDEDFSKLQLAGSSIRKIIKENHDPRTKAVGDRVLVWDMSRLTEAEIDTYVKDDKIYTVLEKYHSIVVEDRCKYEATIETLGGVFTVNLDLKIWNKHLNKVYRTNSEFVKLT